MAFRARKAFGTFEKQAPGVNLFSFVVQDGLLAQGNQDLILRIFNRIPKMSADGKRLQVNYSKEIYERVLRILM